MKKVFFFFLAVFIFFIFPQSALAAKFNLAPTSQDLTVNQEFQLSINLDTQGKEVNGVQAEIVFSKDLLEVVGIEFSDIFPSNFQSTDSSSGIIKIASGEDLPTASFNDSSNWATIKLKAKSSGTGEIQFSCSDSYILELETTANLLDCSSLAQGSYSISQEQTPTTEASPAPTTEASPAPTSEPTQASEPTSCSDSSPTTPTNLRAVSGPNIGEVKLTWTKSNQADYYNLVFGPGARNYQYGAPNIGNTNQYIVKQLAPGNLYYFAITAIKGCASSGLSAEVSARAKAAPVSKTIAPVRKSAKKLSPSPKPTIPYRPIKEVMPRFLLPFEEKEIKPTPTLEPEKGVITNLIENKFLVRSLILIGSIILISGLIFLVKHFLSPEPKVVLPKEEKPISPPERKGDDLRS